jgi:hypothetical protein
MGTLQLLLIVVGLIAVGIAVSVGIGVFGSNADSTTKDALVQDCIRIAAQAQSFYRKPSMLGGGNHSFDNITIVDCGMEDMGDGGGENINGAYYIEGSGTDFAVMGTSVADGSKIVTVYLDMTQTDPELRMTVEYDGW